MGLLGINKNYVTKIWKEFDLSSNETALVAGDLDITQHAQPHSSTIHFKL